jgi:hypothetical protein
MLCCVGQYLWCMVMQAITSCSSCLHWQNNNSGWHLTKQQQRQQLQQTMTAHVQARSQHWTLQAVTVMHTDAVKQRPTLAGVLIHAWVHNSPEAEAFGTR